MTAGTMLRQLRVDAGLTQVELAERSGVPQPTVSLYESGKQVPNADTFLRLVAATGHALQPVRARRPLNAEQVGEILPQLLRLAEAIPRRGERRPLEFPPLTSTTR